MASYMSQVSAQTPRREPLDEFFQRISTELMAVATNYRAVAALTEAAAGLEDPPTIQLAAPEAALKPLDTHFTVGWLAADLIDAGALELVTTDTVPDGTRLTDGKEAWTLTTVDDTPRVVAVGDSLIAEAVEGTVGNHEGAGGFRLRTVGRTQVLETLAETFEPSVADDFESGVAAAAPIAESALTPYHIALLVGARHEYLQYEFGHWGEDIRFTSQATLSRKKRALTEAGLVETTSVKHDVGRPRHRLHLSGPLGACDDIEAVVERAEAELA
jgi:hypothetical protein